MLVRFSNSVLEPKSSTLAGRHHQETQHFSAGSSCTQGPTNCRSEPGLPSRLVSCLRFQRFILALCREAPSLWIYLGVAGDLVERPGFLGTHSIHYSSSMGPPPWLEDPLNHSMFPCPPSQADLFIGHPRNAVPPSLSPCATRFLLGLEHLRGSHKTTVCWRRKACTALGGSVPAAV